MQNKKTKITIDICIVATLRPEILKKTVVSFCKHVRGNAKINIRINIDRVPMMKPFHEIQKVYDMGVLMGMFLESTLSPLKTYIGEPGNFAVAVKRLWGGATADYVFHLEDDWEFIRDIDLNECIKRMENEGFDYMRFPKVNAPELNELPKVALQPSFWKGDVVRSLAKHMVTDKDPEKQLRIGQGNKKLDKILVELQNKGLKEYCLDWCCKDIGREWRDAQGLVKWNKNKGNKNITWSMSE